MANLTAKEKDAVLNALARLMLLSRHSLSPTQTKIAAESACELLWVLGVPEFKSDGRVYTMKEPVGPIVDVSAQLLLKGAAE